MEENRSAKPEESQEKSNSSSSNKSLTTNSKQGLRPLSEIDQQEGAMNNGTLGGNLEETTHQRQQAIDNEPIERRRSNDD